MNETLFKKLESEISAPVTDEVRKVLDELCEEYQQKGTLSLDTLSKLVGRPPVIPESPDTDAMLDAFNARASYGRKCIAVENFVKEYLKSK